MGSLGPDFMLNMNDDRFTSTCVSTCVYDMYVYIYVYYIVRSIVICMMKYSISNVYIYICRYTHTWRMYTCIYICVCVCGPSHVYEEGTPDVSHARW